MSTVFTSAFEITEKVLALPSSAQLAQNAIHLCQCAHPKDPRDLDFDLAEDFIKDGFIHQDITIDDCHHFLFTTDKMINILSCRT